MQRTFIFQIAYWREFRTLFKRCRRDSHARKALLTRCLGLAYFVGVGTFEYKLFSSFHDLATAIVMGCVVIVIGGVIAAVRFSQWREAQRQLAADIASVPPETTARVQRLAYGLTAVIERALAERWLTLNTVPEGATVVARRIQIETLRKHGIWDEMPAPARLAMMEPDAAWPDERIRFVLSTGEKLNTLLWALALQPSLRPVEELLSSLSMNKLSKSLQKPAPGIRPAWDLRVERNRASDYFWRCFAEGVHRGVFEPADEDQAKAVDAWIKEIAERGEDRLAGASTIRELDNVAVGQAGSSSAQRAVLLDRLIDALDGKNIWDEMTEIVYAPLLPQESTTGDPAEDTLTHPIQ